MDCKSGGLLPFPRTGCVPNARVIVAQNDDEGSTPKSEGGLRTGNVELPDESSTIRKLSQNPRRREKLTRCSERIRCGTECSRNVYSVRIGPPQPMGLLA
jgi:hypothetical protein